MTTSADDRWRMPIHDPPTFTPEVDAARATLLRRGVAVLFQENTPTTRSLVYVSSIRPEWAERAMAELLPDTEFEWRGETPRELRPRAIHRCREREPGRLQLRVVVGAEEHVDEILVAEDDHIVTVVVNVCMPVAGPVGELCDVPHHIYLDRPLGTRKVIDAVRGEELEFFDLDALWERAASKAASPTMANAAPTSRRTT